MSLIGIVVPRILTLTLLSSHPYRILFILTSSLY